MEVGPRFFLFLLILFSTAGKAETYLLGDDNKLTVFRQYVESIEGKTWEQKEIDKWFETSMKLGDLHENVDKYSATDVSQDIFEHWISHLLVDGRLDADGITFLIQALLQKSAANKLSSLGQELICELSSFQQDDLSRLEYSGFPCAYKTYSLKTLKAVFPKGTKIIVGARQIDLELHDEVHLLPREKMFFLVSETHKSVELKGTPENLFTHPPVTEKLTHGNCDEFTLDSDVDSATWIYWDRDCRRKGSDAKKEKSPSSSFFNKKLLYWTLGILAVAVIVDQVPHYEVVWPRF